MLHKFIEMTISCYVMASSLVHKYHRLRFKRLN